MFNWFKSGKTPAALPDELQMVLANFVSDANPIPLAELAMQVQYSPELLQLTLPFAAQSIVAELEPALKAAGFAGQLQVKLQSEIAFSFRSIKQIILVASGKGGVGKSTTAVNLAVALAQQGAAVGLLDADIYGPSIPLMLGLTQEKASSPDEKHLNALHKYGIFIQSIGFLVDPLKAAVWRGPMASQALLQLLNETLWPELDYLIVDMPPGTGDIQLTLAQKLPVAGAVVVTTPQDVALADAEKAISMFRQVNIPLLGLIENMSFYQCPSCGHADDVFGTAGGLNLATRYQVSVLGQLPLLTAIREYSDSGTPIATIVNNQTAEIYRKIARQLIFTLYWQQDLALRQQPNIIITDD